MPIATFETPLASHGGHGGCALPVTFVTRNQGRGGLNGSFSPAINTSRTVLGFPVVLILPLRRPTLYLAVDAMSGERYLVTLPHQVTVTVDLINWRGFAVGSTCVVGLQWGDEAKGKIVDLLCDQHDVVVRYQGGANAGHTVVTTG